MFIVILSYMFSFSHIAITFTFSLYLWHHFRSDIFTIGFVVGNPEFDVSGGS